VKTVPVDAGRREPSRSSVVCALVGCLDDPNGAPGVDGRQRFPRRGLGLACAVDARESVHRRPPGGLSRGVHGRGRSQGLDEFARRRPKHAALGVGVPASIEPLDLRDRRPRVAAVPVGHGGEEATDERGRDLVGDARGSRFDDGSHRRVLLGAAPTPIDVGDRQHEPPVLGHLVPRDDGRDGPLAAGGALGREPRRRVAAVDEEAPTLETGDADAAPAASAEVRSGDADVHGLVVGPGDRRVRGQRELRAAAEADVAGQRSLDADARTPNAEVLDRTLGERRGQGVAVAGSGDAGSDGRRGLGSDPHTGLCERDSDAPIEALVGQREVAEADVEPRAGAHRRHGRLYPALGMGVSTVATGPPPLEPSPAAIRFIAPIDGATDMEFRVVQGDIAAQSADALVNAAGTSLTMGSGVAGALRRAGGQEIDDAAVAKGPIDLGEVAVTDAYDLDAEYVIHAAAMPHYGDGQATAASIRDATRNALAKADELGCESIVLPALGCGVAGFDFETGVGIVAEVVDGWHPTSLGDVRLIAYSDEEYERMRGVAGEYDGFTD